MSSDQAREPILGTDKNSSRAMDEATALSALVTALTPMDQTARVRLLRTVSTFFELKLQDLAPDSAPLQRSAIGGGSDADRRGASNPSFSEDRSMSPKAFLLEKRPQSDIERIACLAYYLTHYREQATFKTLELSKLNTEAAQIKLSNPTRAVDNAASAHFLLPAGQGKKQLSAIGELYVQALPDRMAAREAVADLKRRRAKGRARSTGGEEPTSGQEQGDESMDDVDQSEPLE
jgi:hypothetical protein